MDKHAQNNTYISELNKYSKKRLKKECLELSDAFYKIGKDFADERRKVISRDNTIKLLQNKVAYGIKYKDGKIYNLLRKMFGVVK